MTCQMDFAHYHLVDVFSERPFAGNQLAVFPDGAAVPSECMQRIARELNLAETVFVLPSSQPQCQFRFRIFTPMAELPFAGHPTIGTACVLAELGFVRLSNGEGSMTAEEGVGPVPIVIRKIRDLFAAQFSAAMLPQTQPGTPSHAALSRMLSLEEHEILEAKAFSCGLPFLFVHLKNPKAVSRIRFDTSVWHEELSNAWATEVYAFAREENHIFARMFAPRLGIAEDPATGGAAAALAGMLVNARMPDSTLSWTISQGVEMERPSVLDLEADVKAGAVCAVRVGGKTVPMGEGKMRILLPRQ